MKDEEEDRIVIIDRETGEVVYSIALSALFVRSFSLTIAFLLGMWVGTSI